MDRVAVTANPLRPTADGYLPGLVQALREGGVEVRLDPDAAGVAGVKPDGELREVADWAGLVVAVGGDGSMLRAVQRILPSTRPLLGVNSGRLGFLTYSAATNPRDIAEAIRRRDFVMSERSMVAATLVRDGREFQTLVALNEITVTRRNVARMIAVDAVIDGEMLNQYHADGLIVSSPTGSTAYSMSAGGPVVAPSSPVIILTPICPHALSNRSVVVADHEVVELRVAAPEDGEPVQVTADGESGCLLEPGDVLRVGKAAFSQPLALPPDRTFFETLRLKLRWHGSNV